jgi:hypothetical protein
MLYSKPELVRLAVTIASDAGLDPALVCAHVDCRTRWDSGFAVSSAISYLTHQNFPDPMESEHRSIQWGLMAIQGEFARAEGFDSQRSLSDLLLPEVNLSAGCRLLQAISDRYTDDVERTVQALLNWNRESNRQLAAETLGKLEAYRELIVRIDEAPRAFPRDDSFPLQSRLQISSNALLEVGASTRTRMPR